jgi:hypothetical protein
MKKGKQKVAAISFKPSKATNISGISFKGAGAVKVDAAGRVTAKKKGKGTVTVKAGGKKYKVKIKVK